MKIGGVDPRTLPTEEVFVLPRGEEQLIFRATGLKDMEEFTKLCPEPTAPGKLTKEGWLPDEKDEGYLAIMAEYQKRRMAYIVVHSLVPSQIEWETVVLDNPSTWANWEKELKDNGLSQMECNRVLALVFEANCLDEKKLQKAREVFLQGPATAPAT